MTLFFQILFLLTCLLPASPLVASSNLAIPNHTSAFSTRTTLDIAVHQWDEAHNGWVKISNDIPYEDANKTSIKAELETKKSLLDNEATEKVVELGKVANSVGNWSNLLSKLDNLELSNLKLKFNTLDDAAKGRFADDIADLSDYALLQLEDNFGLLDEWKQIDALSSSAQASQKPLWLQKIHDGNTFNDIRKASYPNNEVYLVNPSDPSKYVRLDSYKPGQEIVSRKFTQFSDIQESTGIKYIQELKDKYPNGVAKIADVPSNNMGGGHATLFDDIGTEIQGQMIFEVPVQTGTIPQSVLNEANTWGIKIRDVQGNLYN